MNKWLIQSSVLVIQTAVFPYYLLFLKNIGESYGMFAVLYAAFALAGAIGHLLFTLLPEHPPIRRLLGASLAGLAVCMASIPFLHTIASVFAVQIGLGLFQSMFKAADKEWSKQQFHSFRQENYGQFALQLVVVLTILGAGWLLDWFSIHLLFWLAAAWYGASALLVWKPVKTSDQ